METSSGVLFFPPSRPSREKVEGRRPWKTKRTNGENQKGIGGGSTLGAEHKTRRNTQTGTRTHARTHTKKRTFIRRVIVSSPSSSRQRCVHTSSSSWSSWLLFVPRVLVIFFFDFFFRFSSASISFPRVFVCVCCMCVVCGAGCSGSFAVAVASFKWSTWRTRLASGSNRSVGNCAFS